MEDKKYNEVNKAKDKRKKFVRYKEGAELYSMGITKFQEIAKEAGAVYKVGQLCLINTDKIDEYLEGFRIDPRYEYQDKQSVNLYTIYRIYGDFRMHTKFYEKEMKQMNNTALSAAHMVAMVNEGKVIT